MSRARGVLLRLALGGAACLAAGCARVDDPVAGMTAIQVHDSLQSEELGWRLSRGGTATRLARPGRRPATAHLAPEEFERLARLAVAEGLLDPDWQVPGAEARERDADLGAWLGSFHCFRRFAAIELVFGTRRVIVSTSVLDPEDFGRAADTVLEEFQRTVAALDWQLAAGP